MGVPYQATVRHKRSKSDHVPGGHPVHLSDPVRSTPRGSRCLRSLLSGPRWPAPESPVHFGFMNAGMFLWVPSGATDLRDRVKILAETVLSDNWGLVKKTVLELRRNNGEWQRQTRETYDRGDGAATLLYNRAQKTVVLTR